MTNACTPNELMKAIMYGFKAKLNLFLWGQPGIGKTQSVYQAVEALQVDVRDRRLVTMNPVDFGFPYKSEDGFLDWVTARWLPHEPESEGIIFLDELNLAPLVVQAAAYGLIQERRLNDYVLPAGWQVIGAGNQTGPGIKPMNPALKNRFTHLYIEADLPSWEDWAGQAGIHPLVLAFVRFRRELFHMHSDIDDAYPTPRAWHKVSDLLLACPELLSDRMHALKLIGGTVGEGAANDFVGSIDIMLDCPTPAEIFRDPHNARLVSKQDAMYAVATALECAIEDQDTFAAALTYLERYPNDEYLTLAATGAIKRNDDLKDTKAFKHFAVSHAAALGAQRAIPV